MTEPLQQGDILDADMPQARKLDVLELAKTSGDITHLLDDTQITTIGFDVVRDFETDEAAREEWLQKAERALESAEQKQPEDANGAPVWRRSHVRFPILLVAAQQFNARAYPAICQSGNMVKSRVIGSDKGRPQIDPSNGQPMMKPVPAPPPPPPQPGQPAPTPQPPQMQPVWQIPPGSKQSRADRVADYMNVYLQYRMDDWEADTDKLLYQLPIIGCGFRKIWWQDGKVHAAFVSAVDLSVPSEARSLADAPRITERINGVFPWQIRRDQATGRYRKVELGTSSADEEAPRELLEQHRLMDLDGDGIDEPYVVTVDRQTQIVLRIEADFGPDDVRIKPTTDAQSEQELEPVGVDRRSYYIKYGFLPNPRGLFYDMGFGHLLDQIEDVIDTAINQMMDAGYAQVAGGGFVSAGLRLQGNDRSESFTWQPGEYKQVQVNSQDLRAGIYERTFPAPSPIMYNLLEMMLGAAKDITSVKDIMTGEASNVAPVGTTLALIEQGLQVFTAIYKRVYRALGNEFKAIYDMLADYGAGLASDYLNVLDDPAADFAKDFSERDMDIMPVADPATVTRMQQMAKAQFLDQMRGKGLNDQEINRRVLEAAGIEDIDSLLPDPNAAPDPVTLAKLRQMQTQGDLNSARAAQAQAMAMEHVTDVGHKIGESVGAAGGASAMASAPGYPLGAAGPSLPSDPSAGSMGSGVVGPGGV